MAALQAFELAVLKASTVIDVVSGDHAHATDRARGAGRAIGNLSSVRHKTILCYRGKALQSWLFLRERNRSQRFAPRSSASISATSCRSCSTGIDLSSRPTYRSTAACTRMGSVPYSYSEVFGICPTSECMLESSFLFLFSGVHFFAQFATVEMEYRVLWLELSR
jgi:hypothetical protein